MSVFTLVEGKSKGYKVRYKSLLGSVHRESGVWHNRSTSNAWHEYRLTDGGLSVHFNVYADVSFVKLNSCLSSIKSLEETLMELKEITKYGGYEISSDSRCIVVCIALKSYVLPLVSLLDLQRCLFATQREWRQLAKQELRRRQKEVKLNVQIS